MAICHIILLASAGTGKTDTLSKRIVNIINKGRAKPSEILCITFTNKACKEMMDR
ncbi:UvrD-helicase domain-containing protein [Clostridium putrefaciens]|uniref:UvrD-helicase domain-containing protein n=1 Tax=Clostridium putrefaciens TaxID=99675 RepID=UPI00311935CE